MFVQRRLKNPRHQIFGSTGAEYWYSGRKDYSNAKMTILWNRIETDTLFREVDFPLWPAGDRDLRDHLRIALEHQFEENLWLKYDGPETDPDAEIRIDFLEVE